MEEVACNICGSSESLPLFSTNDYITHTAHKIVQCKSCGLTYVNPQPTKEELPSFYPEIYYGEEPFSYEKIDARSRHKKLRKFLSGRKGRILDVGCGKGLLLKLCKDAGWQVAGIELSEDSTRYARETLGLEVFTSLDEKHHLRDNSLDIITFFHSLEHLKDPLSYLNDVKRLLKPDGIIIIEVPRFNSFYSKIFRDKWFHLDVPRHLFHFDDHTIKKLIILAGYHIIEIKKYALMYDSFGALQSILNSICSEYNLLNDINTKRLRIKDIMKPGQKRIKIDAIISFLLQSFLFPPLLILSLFLSIFNIGGTFTIYAKK